MSAQTNKDVSFLSDPELIDIVLTNLRELDHVIETSAPRAATFLAMATVEGILKELLDREDVVRLKKLSTWPNDNQGNQKSKNKLSLKEIASILGSDGRLPKDFDSLYHPLWDLRNQVHIEAALRQQTPIKQSMSQLATASLNALIEDNATKRRIVGVDWVLRKGRADFTAKANLLSFSQAEHGQPTLLITEALRRKDFALTFRVSIPPGALFGVIYNFASIDEFRVVRLDKRQNYSDAGLIICHHWPHWKRSNQFASSPPVGLNSHDLKIEIASGALHVFDGAVELRIQDDQGTVIGWSYDPRLSIGFWAELDRVRIEDLVLT